MTIYLDHAAATPLRGEVLERMMPYLTGLQGNPSSVHSAGRLARQALDEAHETVAGALRADPREVVFTSGGTESINLAIKGAAWAGKAIGNRIVTTAVEHRAVLRGDVTVLVQQVQAHHVPGELDVPDLGDLEDPP